MTLFSRVVTSYVTPQSHRVHGHCEGFHHQLLWQVRTSLERKSNSYSSKAGMRAGSLPTPSLLAAVQPSFWEPRSRGRGEGSWCFLASLGVTALVTVLWLLCLWNRLKAPALLHRILIWSSALAGCFEALNMGSFDVISWEMRWPCKALLSQPAAAANPC